MPARFFWGGCAGPLDAAWFDSLLAAYDDMALLPYFCALLLLAEQVTGGTRTSHLTVSLRGAPRTKRDGVPVTLDSRKAVALLAYLAITGEHQRREALMALLWPESNQAHAHNSLRYTLSVLKKAIDGAWLDAGRESIGLHHNPNLWLDVDHFHSQLATCRTHGHRETDVCPACSPALAQAVTLYRSDFLAGFTLRDSPAFDEWQFLTAEQLRDELASALERLVRYHTTQSAWLLGSSSAAKP
jgi:DNA-binding SARP family transcriptional activator